MIPASESFPWNTSNPANNIVGSVPGRPITPVVVVIARTPATPSDPITFVAKLTSGPVSEAIRSGKGV
jgi:hypothetical protein